MTATQVDRMLTVTQRSKESGIPVDKIRSFINTGELRAINFSRGQDKPRWHILDSDWQAMLDARASKPVKRKPHPFMPKKSKRKDYFAEA